MREIIFRGRRVDNGELVEGDLVHNTFDGASRDIAIGIQEKGCYPVEVLPETVGQFTGLEDKEEKKIWEDDLVQLDGWNPAIMRVSFIEGAFCLADMDGKYLADIYYAPGECIVLRSIHTTPELLK